MDKINRGSEWRKWDLHVHSPFTWVNNQYLRNENGEIGNDEINKYIDKIIESGLSVIGLTNYFKFDDMDFKIKERLNDKGIQTFLNLEVRLNNINKENKMIDYHIIFDPDLDNELIKNLTASLKAKLGETEKAFNQLNADEIENRASVDLDDLLEKLNENGSGLSGKYITGFLSRGHGSATSESDTKTKTIYEDIAKKTQILLHSSDNEKNVIKDREYWLNTSKYIKPLLQSSDAHSLEQIGLKYSWIKAETSFEGLRQIIFEPDSRVVISKEKPEEKRPYLVIDHVTFKQNDELTSVYFNSNLNTIIGGRSNGKSTLTNSIAEALGNPLFSPHNDKSENSGMYSFVNSEFKVYWQNDSNFDNSRDIEFIPQDYMIKLAEDDEARNKLVRSTIQSDETNYQLIRNYEQKVQENLSTIRQLLEKLTNIDNEIAELEAPEGDKSGIESHLENIKQAIRKQSENENFKVEDQEKYQIAYNHWRKLENRSRLSNINLNDISYRKSEYIKLNVNLPKTDDSEYNLQLSSVLDELEKKVNQEWQMRLGLIEKKQKENLADQEENVQKILKSSDYINGQNNIKNNELLKSLSEQQKSEISKLEAFKKFEADKNSLEKSRQALQTNILKAYSNFGKYKSDLVKSFKANPNNGNIEIAIEFTNIPFENKISYLRSNNQINMNFIQKFDSNREYAIEHIFEDEKLVLNQGKTMAELIYDIFSQGWDTLNYVLKYENDNFSQMSQGKKAFVILTLILEFSKEEKPVIIDQPEDSLDNRSIYKELTMYLKTKKKDRQIVLVTHNPNVVIGADAENVIVANQHSTDEPNKKDVQFDYVNGAIENTAINDLESAFLYRKGIREHIIEILEGGKEAFTERENKYVSGNKIGG